MAVWVLPQSSFPEGCLDGRVVHGLLAACIQAKEGVVAQHVPLRLTGTCVPGTTLSGAHLQSCAGLKRSVQQSRCRVWWW